MPKILASGPAHGTKVSILFLVLTLLILFQMMGGQMPQMPRAVTKGSKVFKKVKELSQIGDA